MTSCSALELLRIMTGMSASFGSLFDELEKCQAMHLRQIEVQQNNIRMADLSEFAVSAQNSKTDFACSRHCNLAG